MKQLRTALAGLLTLVVATAAVAQTFPTVPAQTLIGRLGTPGTTGPSQAIPLTSLQAALNATVNTIAALRATTVGASNSAEVLGYYAIGDGGGGTFIWNSTSTATDNNGSIIAVSGVATGRWIRQTAIPNNFTPEMFGAKADGTSDANAFDDLMTYLGTVASAGGTMHLSCGKTYTLARPTGTGPYGTRGNGQALTRLFSNVNVRGCGPSSTIKMANGVNTSSATFAYGLSNTNTLNNVILSDFTLDMNGANNSCSGACYHTNAAIAAEAGDNITLKNIFFKNNPGSNDTVFGSNVEPPTVTNLHLEGLVHENSGDRVNAASTDWSGDFFIASNVTYSNIRHSSGPTVNGSAFELHGTNITASNIAVTDHFNCGIIANEPTGLATLSKGVNLSTVSCNNVKSGLQVYSKAGATETNTLIQGINVNYLAGSSGIAVDACSNMNAASVTNTGLVISDVVIKSSVTTNLGNEAPGISACYWASINISGIQGTNIQGPGISIDNIVSAAAISLSNSQFVNPGRTATAANQVAVRFINTSGNTAGNININGVTSTGTVQYNISGNVNATQATIDAGSLASGATLGQWNWTGTGIAGVIFPQVQTNFRATGGAGQFVKQATLGGQLTVSAPTIAEIAGLAAGCATWLGTPTSANLATCMTDETGSGSAVFGTSPTITTPNIIGTTTNDNAATGSVGEYVETGSGNNNATATITMTIATPAVVTWTGHGFSVGAFTTAIKFTTTGALPTGVTSGTTYYVKAIDANTFNIATSAANALAGTFINTSGSQSGTHTGDIRVGMTTSTSQDLAAFTLGAGDWEVGGQILMGAGATTTVTYVGGNLATTTATLDRKFGRRLSIEFSSNTLVVGNSEFTVFNLGPSRFSLASPTTIFAVGDAQFATSTMISSGWLRARRIR